MPDMSNVTRDEAIADLRTNMKRLEAVSAGLLQRQDTLSIDTILRAARRAMEWAVVMENTRGMTDGKTS